MVRKQTRIEILSVFQSESATYQGKLIARAATGAKVKVSIKCQVKLMCAKSKNMQVFKCTLSTMVKFDYLGNALPELY